MSREKQHNLPFKLLHAARTSLAQYSSWALTVKKIATNAYNHFILFLKFRKKNSKSRQRRKIHFNCVLCFEVEKTSTQLMLYERKKRNHIKSYLSTSFFSTDSQTTIFSQHTLDWYDFQNVTEDLVRIIQENNRFIISVIWTQRINSLELNSLGTMTIFQYGDPLHC